MSEDLEGIYTRIAWLERNQNYVGTEGGSNVFGFDRTVNNEGFGGQTSERISARFGGVTTVITVTGNQIPASGVVAVTAISPPLLTYAGAVAKDQLGWLNGVYGTLLKDAANAYTFTRAEAGTAVASYPESVFTVDLGSYRDRIHIFWAGTNDGLTDPAAIIANIDAAIDAIPSLDKRYLVLSPMESPLEIVGSTKHNEMLACHLAFKKHYKDRFVPVWRRLVESYNPALPQDVIDYANLVVPTSLRSSGVHLEDVGYSIVATVVREFLDRFGW